MLLCSVMLFGSWQTAFAAPEAAPNTEMDVQPKPAQDWLYLHEEAFSAEHSMIGLFAQCTEYFNAGDWDIRRGKLTIRYLATQLSDRHISNITVSLNGRPIHSARVIPDTEGKIQEIVVKLPPDGIIKGQNAITIDSYVRTQDSLPCVDDVSSASWLNLYKDSFVSLSYLPKAPCNSVADLYEQFTSIDALENHQSDICLSDSAGPAEVTAAALALSGISKNAVIDYQNIGLSQINQESDLFQNKYQIFFESYSKLSPALKKMLTNEQQQAAETGAVMVLLKSNEDSNMLLITGNDPLAVKNAASLLGNVPAMKQVQSTWRKVSGDENVATIPSDRNDYIQLTQTGSYLKGSFRQAASYYIEFPANRKLSVSSELSLAMRYSENLDFDRSLVTVYINDVPIGSKKLQKENGNGDTASFHLPADLNVSGNFTIKVGFDLEIKDMWCTLRQGETPWAWVTEESMLKIASVENDTILFESYPSPFIKDGSMNNVVVLLPDEPKDADFEAFRSILLTLGRYQKDNTGSLQVAQMSNPGDLKASNVIAIGRLDQNGVVQQINEQLYFKFSPDGATILSNEKMLIEPNYGASLGTVQLLQSPFTEEKRALMVVSGVSDEGMLRTLDYIGASDGLWKLYGDGYVADGVDVFPFRFSDENANRRPIIKELTQRGDLGGFVLIGLLMLVLLGLSATMISLKYRKKVRHEK